MAGESKQDLIRVPAIAGIDLAAVRMDKAAKGQAIGITTGFSDLDRITGGLRPKELIIIAARPGAGKTALSIHIARRVATRGHHVVFFSLEMGDIELADRMIVGSSGIDKDKYKSGKISQDEFKRAYDVVHNDIAKLNIRIDDTPRQTVLTIANKLRLLKKRGHCDVAIIDYLQLIKSSDRGRSRDEEVGSITRELKIIAKELEIPVILLCQMNREVEKRGNKAPILSDLRESGSIEQDADIVIFIHRPVNDGESEVDIVDSATGRKDVFQLFVRKNRDGQCGVIKIVRNETMTAFYDYDYRNVTPTHSSVNPDRFHEPDVPF
jgi:replicative DNA helicase